MDNLHIWNAVSQAPPAYLKKITGGRLKGMSDINPQWRYRAMTELFGPCGVGWKLTIERLWTENTDRGEVFAFSQVSVYIKVDGAWSEAIPGVGGSKLCEAEREGLHANDEGYKMATTDALGTALKMLGVAADVYLGNWDGSKYLDRETGATAPPASGKNSFGTTSPPPKPKSFKWSDATGAQQRDFTIAKIHEAAQSQDPKGGLSKLMEIMAKLNTVEHRLAQPDLDAIAEAALKAEQDLNAIASGQ